MTVLLLLIVAAFPQLVLLPLALVVAVGGLAMLGAFLFYTVAALVSIVVGAIKWAIGKIWD